MTIVINYHIFTAYRSHYHKSVWKDVPKTRRRLQYVSMANASTVLLHFGNFVQVNCDYYQLCYKL